MLLALGIVTCTELYQQRALLSLLFSESSWHYFLHVALGLGSTDLARYGDRLTRLLSFSLSFISVGLNLQHKGYFKMHFKFIWTALIQSLSQPRLSVCLWEKEIMSHFQMWASAVRKSSERNGGYFCPLLVPLFPDCDRWVFSLLTKDRWLIFHSLFCKQDVVIL